MELDQKDFGDLKKAKQLLENPSIAAKLTNLIGAPIEKGFELLPTNWKSKIGEITQHALTKAIHTAVFTMNNTPRDESSNLMHKLAVAATGGVGGFFGLPAMAIELPISTTIMLRSIGDIARSEGEDVCSNETKLACIEVFALGGTTSSDDSVESAYFVIRAALARSVTEASEYIAGKGLAEEGEVYHSSGRTFWYSGFRESCRTSNPSNRSSWRFHNKYPIYRSFSRHGSWAFYRPTTRKKIWG